MKLEIITPSGVLFNNDVESVIAPGSKGAFQVLNNHAELLTTLDVGALDVNIGGKSELFTCNYGLLEVKENTVSVLTEASEKVADIDLERAKGAQDRAQDRLKSKNDEVDFDRAQIALTKAINRIKLSQLN